MERAHFCAFSHFLADMFHKLRRLSCTLKKNDLILPKATSELQRTVIELEGMKVRPKRGGMLERFTACTQKATGKFKFQVCEEGMAGLYGILTVNILIFKMLCFSNESFVIF